MLNTDKYVGGRPHAPGRNAALIGGGGRARLVVSSSGAEAPGPRFRMIVIDCQCLWVIMTVIYDP